VDDLKNYLSSNIRGHHDNENAARIFKVHEFINSENLYFTHLLSIANAASGCWAIAAMSDIHADNLDGRQHIRWILFFNKITSK
jgi:hypothetical protein